MSSERYFNPRIPGLETLLLQAGPERDHDEVKDKQKGFLYYPESGLTIVVYGPPGVGKTILALQMAMAAALEGKRVIYLTKDTPARVLCQRISTSFHNFGHGLIEATKKSSPGEPFIEYHIDSSHKGTENQISPRIPLEAKIRTLTFSFLNEIATGRRFPERERLRKRKRLQDVFRDEENCFFAFANFTEVPAGTGGADRYLRTRSVYYALGHLQPDLKPLFLALGESIPTNPAEFSSDDFCDLPEFIKRLMDEPNGVSQHLRDRLNPKVRKQLSSAEPASRKLEATLIGELNKILKGASIYDEVHFQGVELSPEARRLIKNSRAKDCTRLNKLLLKDAYPNELSGRKQSELVIVCDALSPGMLEENFRLHASYDLELSSKCGANRPLFVFLMESEEMPSTMSVAFPPDIQICLGTREDPHGIVTRTVQLLKTRFQKSLDEKTPLLVLGESECDSAVHEWLLIWKGGQWELTNLNLSRSQISQAQQPGIRIVPPMAYDVISIRRSIDPPRRSLKFCVKGLDSFTDKEKFVGGGCTLLLTQNRCGSTALSLHYLLGQIGASLHDKSVNNETPKSVLYICFSDDAHEILHTIWGMPALRRCIWDSNSEIQFGIEEVWNKLVDRMAEKLAESTQQKHASKSSVNNTKRQRWQGLYAIPLLHKPVDSLTARCDDSQSPYLYIFVPDFSWITVEEAMDQVVKLLRHGGKGPSSDDCLKAHAIDRIVLDRVGRLQARWPLVMNGEVFISSLVALCGRHNIEILLVDDTAVERESAGLVKSHWLGMAQNVIRLRRIPFHGTETIAVELIRAGGRIVTWNRPHEVMFSRGVGKYSISIEVGDSFRGYTNLLGEAPRRCKMRVDLSFDAEDTPLWRDVSEIKRHLESAMDGVIVNVIGPGQWSGINSAFNNVSSVARDICHIVAIDGIWLGPLFEDWNGILNRFSSVELKSLLPDHISKVMRWTDDPRLFASDVPNIANLVGKLNASFLFNMLSNELQDEIVNWTPISACHGFKQRVVEGLNRILEGASIYREKKFSKVKLSKRTNNLLRVSSKDESAFRLNRSLLEDLFPSDILQWQESFEIALEEELDKHYVTQSITTAIANIRWRQAQGLVSQGEIKGGFRYAIPLRHNWGIMAVTKLSRRSMVDAFNLWFPPIHGEIEFPSTWADDKRSTYDSKQDDFIRRFKRTFDVESGKVFSMKKDNVHHVLAVMLGWDYGKPTTDCVPEMAAWKIRRAIWDAKGPEDLDGCVSWQDLADFRTDYWHPFWADGWRADLLTKLAQKQAEGNLRVLLFPRIELFGFATASEESVVSLFLELLLANVKWETLFVEVKDAYHEASDLDKYPPLLKFRSCPESDEKDPDTVSNCREGFISTIVLLFRLLSPTQRRQLAIGFTTSQTDLGVELREKWLRANYGKAAFSNWPKQIFLFSRQWVTTIQDLMPHHDIRETIRLAPLPGGRDKAIIDSYWRTLAIPGSPPKCGPTVSGTWYLGVLRGGNTDLGAEVIKEIVSAEHESRRHLERCCAPVSKELYKASRVDRLGCTKKKKTGPGKEQAELPKEWLPYGDIMHRAYNQKPLHEDKNKRRPVCFPFHRTQILEYMRVSPILFNLLRRVMEVRSERDDVEDEKLLSSGNSPHFGKLREKVEPFVDRAFELLNDLAIR